MDRRKARARREVGREPRLAPEKVERCGSFALRARRYPTLPQHGDEPPGSHTHAVPWMVRSHSRADSRHTRHSRTDSHRSRHPLRNSHYSRRRAEAHRRYTRVDSKHTRAEGRIVAVRGRVVGIRHRIAVAPVLTTLQPISSTSVASVAFSTEIPIVRNGLRLWAEVLEQVRDTLDGLAADFQRLYEQTR